MVSNERAIDYIQCVKRVDYDFKNFDALSCKNLTDVCICSFYRCMICSCMNERSQWLAIEELMKPFSSFS